MKPVLATPENTRCYSAFEKHLVRIEGPEFNRDFTYYLVHKMPDLKNLEKGIHLSQFNGSLVIKRIELEFRTLQKMCFHKDHVLNLFTSFDIRFHKINRYKDILPFLHNRVVLKENPILPIAPPKGKSNNGSSDGDYSLRSIEPLSVSDCQQQIAPNLIDIHGSDVRLQTYFNASYINSLIKRIKDKGSSYIASSSPGLKTSRAR